MKKQLSFLAVFVVLSCFALPAKADTNISFSFNASPFHVMHGYKEKAHHRKNVHHRKKFHSRAYKKSYHHRQRIRPRAHYRAVRRSFFSPFYYAPRPSTVIVQRTVVQSAPQSISYAEPLQAAPVSGDYLNASGQYCREYQAVGSVSGSGASLYGTACLQSDGTWRVVN